MCSTSLLTATMLTNSPQHFMYKQNTHIKTNYGNFTKKFDNLKNVIEEDKR